MSLVISDAMWAVCNRLHDPCRALSYNSTCGGPEFHFVDALNVTNALLELPVAQRMEAMGMEPVVVDGVHQLFFLEPVWAERGAQERAIGDKP